MSIKSLLLNQSIILFLCLSFGCVGPLKAADQLGYVSDCSPCDVKLGPNNHSYSFYFEIIPFGVNEKKLEKIYVKTTSSDKTVQELQVSDMDSIFNEEKFFFYADDINFDGLFDIFLITSSGAANSYANYWTFDREKSGFKFLGNFPVFKIDKAAKNLMTYERFGSGGMEYVKKTYKFLHKELLVTEVEEQHFDKEENSFVKIKKTLIDNTLVTTGREIIKTNN